MGKLGARELNVSSDIDLIYVFDSDGQTAGVAQPGGQPRGVISTQEYFGKLVRAMQTLIGSVTEHGFVFRVDLALRPNGELAFTRRGDLKLNGSGVLEMGTGALVRGQNGGGPITIPPGFFVKISKDGSIYATNPTQAGVAAPVLIDKILLRDASQVSLERREDSLYKIVGKPNNEDIPVTGKLATLTPETLEGSNVNAMEVMVKLMDQSRSFEMQVNVIKQNKDVDESGGTMMRASA